MVLNLKIDTEKRRRRDAEGYFHSFVVGIARGGLPYHRCVFLVQAGRNNPPANRRLKPLHSRTFECVTSKEAVLGCRGSKVQLLQQ